MICDDESKIYFAKAEIVRFLAYRVQDTEVKKRQPLNNHMQPDQQPPYDTGFHSKILQPSIKPYYVKIVVSLLPTVIYESMLLNYLFKG